MGLLDDSFISFVNLKHRKDRLDSITSQLNKLGIKATRTPGVYPDERAEEKSVMTKMLTRKQVGALGCYLAQVDIMREALVLKKHAFVLEDDVIFCGDFLERIGYIDNWMRIRSEHGEKRSNTFDILWLGATFHINPPYWHKDTLGFDAQITSDPRIVRTFGSFNTYGYIVHYESIEKVLKKLEEFLPNSIGIDHSMINISPCLYTYAFVPGMLKQMDNLSDQIPGKEIVTEFSSFAKLGPYWWQDKMSDFDPTSYNWAEANNNYIV